MSEIKAGDLVMVVRPTLCCGYAGGVGRVFKAQRIDPNGFDYYCDACGNDGIGTQVLHEGTDWFDTYRLIRIDPPAQPESVETDREVVA